MGLVTFIRLHYKYSILKYKLNKGRNTYISPSYVIALALDIPLRPMQALPYVSHCPHVASHTTIRLSDEAWQEHLDAAYLLGILRHSYKVNRLEATRPRGLYKYWLIISSLRYDDTRPDYLLTHSTRRIMHGNTPAWTIHTPRKVRKTYIPHPALQAFLTIAQMHGILSQSDTATTDARIGLVLEAIGCKFLSPSQR